MKFFAKKSNNAKEVPKQSKSSGFLVEQIKNRYLKLDGELTVPQATKLVLCVRDKVADLLAPGTYKINSGQLPGTFGLLKKLYRLNMRRPPTHIYIDGYFITTKTVSVMGVKTQTILCKLGRKTIRFSAILDFDFIVNDEKKFIKVMFEELKKIEEQKCINAVREIMIDIFSKIYEKTGTYDQLLTGGDANFIAKLKDGLNKRLADFGVGLNSLVVKKIEMPQKFMPLVQPILSKREQKDPVSSVISMCQAVTEPVVLDKVGNEFLQDKTIEVVSTTQGQLKEQTEILELATGDQASSQIVFSNFEETSEEGPTLEETTQTPDANIFCTKCGKKARDDDMFCGGCGNKL